MAKTLLELLEENNIKVIKRGDKWVARCPLHEGDRNPSFTVYPDLTYWCFGCRRWGDAVKFLTDYKGMSYEQALEYAGFPARRERPIKRVIKVKHTYDVYPYIYETAVKYHEFLLKTPGAKNYLYGRGLTDHIIRKYKVGFTDGGIVNPQTAHEFDTAFESGILSRDEDGNWWESLAHRITIPNVPMLNEDWSDFMTGRTVTKSNVKYLGLRIPKPIYGLYEASDSPILFLVEGHFDWLILKQWDYPAIVVGGTNIPAYNLPALKSRFVVIVPDNDDEGIKAATSLHEKLPNSLILDYQRWGVKDVADLALMENGREKFDYEVIGQVPWLPNLSLTTLEKWFQRVNPYRDLQSI